MSTDAKQGERKEATSQSESVPGRTEQPDSARAADEAPVDDKAVQSAEKRAEHNQRHVPDRQFVANCYFCTAQQSGSSLPVTVPDDVPSAPGMPGTSGA